MLVVLTHMSLAAAGLGVWVTFLVLDRMMFAWMAIGILGNSARDPVRTIALGPGSPLCKPTQSPEPAHGIDDNQFCSQSRLSLRGS